MQGFWKVWACRSAEAVERLRARKTAANSVADVPAQAALVGLELWGTVCYFVR